MRAGGGKAVRLTGRAAEAAQVKLGGDLDGHHAVLLQEVQRHLAKRLVPHHHLGPRVCEGGGQQAGVDSLPHSLAASLPLPASDSPSSVISIRERCACAPAYIASPHPRWT